MKIHPLLWLLMIVLVLWFLYLGTPNSVTYAKSGFLRWLPFILAFFIVPFLFFKFINSAWQNNAGWSVAIAATSVLVIGPTLGIVGKALKQEELKKTGILTNGVVVEKWYATRKGPDEWLLICEYKVGRESYTTFSIQDKENRFSLGDTLQIIYSTTNPNNSEVLELTDLEL